MTFADPIEQANTTILPRQRRAQEAVARAIEVATPNALPRLERGARWAACREAVAAYAKSLRDDGMPPATVVATVKALIRGAPARSVGALREAMTQWSINAYYQGD
jgi:hypothetical protein